MLVAAISRLRDSASLVRPDSLHRFRVTFILAWLFAMGLVNAAAPPIAAGYDYSLFLKTDGTCWASGQIRNYFGEDLVNDPETPAPVIGDVQAFSAGKGFSLFLKKNGTVWATGANSSGQLGDGTLNGRRSPVQVLGDVQAIAASRATHLSASTYSLFLKTDGTVWATGSNFYGQHGNGTTTTRTAPVQVSSGVQAISAGTGHSLILKSDGTAWASGANFSGQLGDGTLTDRKSFVKVMTGVQAISAGASYSLFLKTNGTVWATGANTYGQLGDGLTSSRSTPVQVLGGVKEISAGPEHALYLKTDGTVWAAGYNANGQLGNGTKINLSWPMQTLSGVSAISAGLGHSMFLKTDGTVWTTWIFDADQPGDGTTPARWVNLDAALSPNPDLTNLTLSAGTLTPAFSNDVATYTATVSYKTTDIAITPTASDAKATVKITVNGTTVASGKNSPLVVGENQVTVLVSAQDGIATRSFNITVKRDEPPPVPPVPQVEISAGEYHSLFLKVDGSVWASGFNYNGELGDGTKTHRKVPVKVMTGAKAVAAGWTHSLFLKNDGTAWTTGSYDYTPGPMSTIKASRTTPVQVMTRVAAIAAGRYHSLFLRTDGTVWGMGSNYLGPLGDGTTTSRMTPVQIMSGVGAIAAGDSFSLFLRTDGTVWAVGANYFGQLGDQTATSRLIPVPVLGGVKAIAAGSDHSLYLMMNGTAWATGRNLYGQLGDGTLMNKLMPVLVMSDVDAIAAGEDHSHFLKKDGTLWATGLNEYGQLGDGTTIDRGSPVMTRLTNVKKLAAGYGHTLYVKKDDTIWAAGLNNWGQIGNGTYDDIIEPSRVMGSFSASPEISVLNGKTNLTDGKWTITCGKIKVGKSLTFELTIKNTGTATLSRIAASTVGGQATQFAVVGKPAASLAPGKSTQVTITFKPKKKGDVSTTLRIASNDADENPFEIKLTGSGTGAARKARSPRPALVLLRPDTGRVAGKAGNRAGIKTGDEGKVALIASVEGERRLSITLDKTRAPAGARPLVEVSPDLLHWFSGSDHTRVLEDSSRIYRVGDRTGTTATAKRFIRVRWIRDER